MGESWCGGAGAASLPTAPGLFVCKEEISSYHYPPCQATRARVPDQGQAAYSGKGLKSEGFLFRSPMDFRTFRAMDFSATDFFRSKRFLRVTF